MLCQSVQAICCNIYDPQRMNPNDFGKFSSIATSFLTFMGCFGWSVSVFEGFLLNLRNLSLCCEMLSNVFVSIQLISAWQRSLYAYSSCILSQSNIGIVAETCVLHL